MTRIICFASVMYFKIRFFLEIGYHKDSNFPFAAGLRIICFASVMYFKIRFFLEIGYHKDSNFPFAAGLKLLHIVFGILRSKKAFDPDHIKNYRARRLTEGLVL